VRCALGAAALCAAAGCHSQKRPPAPVPTRPPAVAPAPADAGPPPETSELAWEKRDSDPGAVDRAVSLFEAEARRAADPAPLWLGAARARRLRIARVEQYPDPEASTMADDAQACLADARRAQAGTSSRPEATEALYLQAVCAAIWARMQGFTPLIERRAELTEALQRVAEVDPDLDGAGAERELGALYAALPAYAGGDLEEARRHLLVAVERAPDDARNHLVLARAVAVKAQDRALFREHLEIAAKSGDPVAAAQAQALLDRERELFGPAEAAQPIPGGPQKRP
jgi:tetratricopeptide (TPR) repeat protein